MVGTSAYSFWCTVRAMRGSLTSSKPSIALLRLYLSALQQVMHGHGAAVVVDVVAALTVGEDLGALDEAGWVRSGRRKWVGGVSVSDSGSQDR